MRYFLFVLLAALVLAGCQKQAATPPPASPNAKTYKIHGTVQSVDKAAKTILLKHDAIPGYMEDGMTMEFPVRSEHLWDVITPGSTIDGDLVVDNQNTQPFWIENLIVSAPADPSKVPVNGNFAQIGQPVPDFTLTNQDGKPVSLHDFKGKALAITFIYARCPLPDYCTRMSTNFSNIAMQLQNDPDKDKIRLLTISFDPENDTPAKLKAYGIGYMGNDKNYKFDTWQLAVGKDAEVRKIANFFGMEYHTDENDKAKINHTLVTAVIDPSGKVKRIFTGNSWTTVQLLAELKAAAV
ncbi:MAG: SCO family protein [Pyrinomonadaceae bacterium]